MHPVTLLWSGVAALLYAPSLAAILPDGVRAPAHLEKRNNCGPGIGSCSGGMCCSKWGYCGTTADYCGDGCQSAYGSCTAPLGACGPNVGSCAAPMCCSQYGYCGTTADYCGAGCQVGFGQCGITPEVKCGATSGSCPAGSCCSKWGYCGTTADYCGAGCQPTYGLCIPSISPDASCGPGSVGNYTCKGSAFGKCCSQWGWCGSIPEYCGTGCQKAYGTCN